MTPEQWNEIPCVVYVQALKETWVFICGKIKFYLPVGINSSAGPYAKPDFIDKIKDITCHFRNAIVFAAPVGPNCDQGRNSCPAVHRGREPSSQAELDQG